MVGKRLLCWGLALLWAVQLGWAENESREPAAGQSYGVGAAAAVVLEAETGELLFAQNGDQQLPMASTTKIMTALLTLEQPQLDLPFPVDDEAIRVEGSSMGLVQGDTVTLRALAGGMLTASGNDAANAAAVRIAGSIPAFVARMNRRAQELGLTNTHFTNPSGLDAAEHYSTARELALLGREALRNPTFLEMCSAKKLTLFFGNPPYERTLYNHNRLLNRYPPAIGIKTGFTRDSGRCLVSAARKEGVTLLCVTLRCGDDWGVHQALYQRYFPTVAQVELAPPGKILLPVVGGGKSAVELLQATPVTAASIAGEPPRVDSTVFADYFAYAPIKKGDRLGKIVYYRDKKMVGQSDLLAAEDIPGSTPTATKRSEDNIWHRIREFKRLWGTAASSPDAKPRNISRPAESPSMDTEPRLASR